MPVFALIAVKMPSPYGVLYNFLGVPDLMAPRLCEGDASSVYKRNTT